MTRGSDINNLARLRAVLTSPGLYQLAGALEWERRVGRPPVHPPYVLLAYGTLARLARSGVRVEHDFADPATWDYARRLMAETISRYRYDLPPPPLRPPCWEHWRWIRDHHLATDQGLALLGREFPKLAVATARHIGLLDPGSGGSFTHPAPERAVYGDGTLVRPLYQPPVTVTLTDDDGSTHLAYPDPKTGQLHDQPMHRFDPDLVEHHGRLGPVLTHGYVAWHTRGPKPYQRVVLAADHVDAPGAEAATAVRLLGSVHRAAGAGIQVVIYDGAFTGVHIEEIMRRYGYLVLAKTPSLDPDPTPGGTVLAVNRRGRKSRSYPLGPVTHPTVTGVCAHQLATIGGRVVEIGLDDTGDPVVISEPARGAVKRSRRGDGHYHFNVGYHLACPHEEFNTWLSPHPTAGGDPARPHHLRVIPEDDPDSLRLAGLRSDAENFWSNLKRTLIVDRAMSLGWRRGLVDVYCYALLNNALTETRAAQAEHNQTPRRSRGRFTTA